MSGYGGLYWPWSCPIAVADVDSCSSSNRSTPVHVDVGVVVENTMPVEAVTTTVADGCILQTAAARTESQLVTCRTATVVTAAATAAAAAVVVVDACLPRSLRVTTFIGDRGRRVARATRGRVSSANATAVSSDVHKTCIFPRGYRVSGAVVTAKRTRTAV